MVKNKNNCSKFKFGFSLVEALIVMSIFAIFVAVIANVIPHKAKPKVTADAHGGFECYWSGNKLYSRTITIGVENAPKEETTSDADGKYCLFKPDPYLNYVVFNAVGGGSRGIAAEGGGAGQYASAFFPTPKPVYRLYPGKGGSTVSHPDGYPSVVKSGSDTVLEVKGGNNSAVENTTTDDIINVYLAGKMDPETTAYGCNYTPRVWFEQSDNLIHVSYCATSSDIRERTFKYSDTTLTGLRMYDTILQAPTNASSSKPLSQLKSGTHTWEYYEVGEWVDYGKDPLDDTNCTVAQIKSMSNPMCPSRFKMEILLDLPDNGVDGGVSSLTKYATFLQYNELKAINPGNGGAKNYGNGKHGAILVSW